MLHKATRAAGGNKVEYPSFFPMDTYLLRIYIHTGTDMGRHSK